MGRMKLTAEERGRLGGLTTADRMTAEQRSSRARKGGLALVEKYGKAHMYRLNLRSNGRDVEIGQTDEKAQR